MREWFRQWLQAYRLRRNEENMRRERTFLLLFFLISTVLCGCSGGGNQENDKNQENGTGSQTQTGNSGDVASTGTPVYGGSVIVGITQDLDSLDPHKAVAAGTEEVLFNIYEGLVKPDRDGNLIPAVAESYTMSDDGMSYTFLLREGVKFHDGKPVTAEDVIYSVKRCAGLLEVSDPEVLTVSALSCISDVVKEEAEDGSVKIQILLNTPNTELPAYLTCAIIPENAEDLSKHPIGTGPFQYVSYTPMQSFIMKKNENYYLEGVPYLDEVTFKISANTDSAFLELVAGGIDIFPYLTSEQANQLPNTIRVEKGTMNLVQGLFLNNKRAPFDNKLVRQALFYAVDAQQILEMVGGNGGSVIRTNMFSGFGKYYNTELNGTYTYQPEKARQLLTEAGYPNGIEFTIQVPSNYQYHVDTAQVVVEQLKQAGITAKIQLIEWSTWLSNVYKARDYEATIVGLDAQLAPSDLMKRYRSDASNNFINYENPEFDLLYDQALAAVKDDEKIVLYRELQRILNEDAASVYIQDPPLFVAVNRKLSGYTFYPVYVQDMSTVYYVQTQ